MKHLAALFLSLVFSSAFSQKSTKIFTSDIDNFWVAYDSIQKTDNHSKKMDLIKRLYTDKGTEGLKTFMKVRDYNDTVFVNIIDKYPKFWNSIRPNTLTIKTKTNELEASVAKLKQLYPELKEAEMYFTIGGLNSGGTVSGNKVLVGAEIATGLPSTDVSEFQDDWLKGVFAEQSLDNIVSLNVHEYIHTQQTGNRRRVLSQSIKEGACDLIAELVMNTILERKYLSYGKAHSAEVKELFKKEMFTGNFRNWLYNGRQKGESADLGYYVGYEICKLYYQHAKDKKQAVKDIIELNYDDDKAVEDFLIKSKFFKEKIDKQKLIKEYEKNLPYVVKIDPSNGSVHVSADTKEIRVTFSKEMIPGSYSFNLSDKGRDYYPISKIVGMENNNKTLVMLVNLKPNKEYEFVLTNKSFISKDGYPLKDEKFLIKFKTDNK
ncbi:Ig-like domain-containing protein [Chryseobacterium sp. MEBOG07]|uniref:Ig-like domain-containing protein n=1 Tax=Chryseobacterium sp. MEBOG07 TaxID=2879939 RepID=UPI001F326738|nr:Ig-like domain-containing protein [Chryseobacterium sp. MEBOG07]UKB77846.1 Ig-like domain-containing protein [Chryseobacterium sp. MEBOG07]